MLTCFILIRVEAKKEDQVYNSLVQVKEIEGIREVFGEYDMIARMEARNLKELRSLVIQKVRSVPGILSTTTLITSE